MINIKLAIIHLLQKFRIEKAKETQLILQKGDLFTLRPKEEIKVRLVPRDV